MTRTVSAVAIAALTAAVAVPAGQAPGAGPQAWANDLSPIAASDWSYDRAAHLVERAGFGATPEEVARVAAMTPEQAVNALVSYEAIDDRDQPPFDE